MQCSIRLEDVFRRPLSLSWAQRAPNPKQDSQLKWPNFPLRRYSHSLNQDLRPDPYLHFIYTLSAKSLRISRQLLSFLTGVELMVSFALKYYYNIIIHSLLQIENSKRRVVINLNNFLIKLKCSKVFWRMYLSFLIIYISRREINKVVLCLIEINI